MAPASSHCRLYLKLPAQPSGSLQGSLAAALAEAGTLVQCVLLSSGESEDGPTDRHEKWAEQLLGLAHARDIAFLVETDVDLALRIEADGVQIAADAGAYAAARDRLGPQRIVGVDCGQNRHHAMVLAEFGADYVAFAPHACNQQGNQERDELIAWWSEIFVVPCVAMGVESPDEARSLAVLGADFVAPAESLWQASDAAQRLAAFAEALRQARSAA
jgi:thiamine-phosphate pyrophosphorylase